MLGRSVVVLDDGQVVELRPTMRNQALVYLACSDDWITRDQLAFLFWPDLPDVTARHNVRQLFKRIRQLDWLSGFDVVGDRVRWLVDTDLDVLFGAEPATVVAFSVGELLPGFERGATVEYEEWLLEARRRADGARRAGRLAAADIAAGEGSADRALEVLAPLLPSDQDGSVLVRYMEIANIAGRGYEALAAFDEVGTRLREELGVEPPSRAIELAEDAASQEGLERENRYQVFGRLRELSEIVTMLEQPDVRLVTLLGPGGIGKSALARALVDGAFGSRWITSAFVSLESITDPDLIPAQLAVECGFALDGRLDPVDQLVEGLRREGLLLILDNAEHLSDGWWLFSTLLERCPDLMIVVTSRQRLRLADEWIYEVGGLADDDAVELLIDRAHRVAPDVSISHDQAVAICRLVGASPLAIELAAPWLRAMTPTEVVETVGHDASLLTGGAVDAPSRHRSVDAAMAHSWALADPSERDAVEALSVFAAPYTFSMATAVATAPPVTLRDLVDKSLVQQRRDGLLASHPLVRQYAAARLAADDATRTEVRRRHAEVVLELLASSTEQRGPLIEDAIEAWRWAIEHNDTNLMAKASDGLVRLIERSGRYQQGLGLLTAARSSLDDRRSLSGAAAAIGIGESRLLQRLGRHHDAAVAARRAATAAKASNDKRQLVLALVTWGWAQKWLDGDAAQYATTQRAFAIAGELGDDELSVQVLNGLGCSAPTLSHCRDHLLDGLELARRAELRTMSTVLLNNIGMVAWGLGDHDTAIEHLRDACDLARADDSQRWIAASLSNLAFVHGDRGELAMARRLVDEAEAIDIDSEDLDNTVLGRLIAGEIRRLTGDQAGARQRATEALHTAQALGNEPYILRSLRLHGLLLLDSGDTERGARILLAVLPRTDRRGDFTSEIQNPRLLAQINLQLDPHAVVEAERWARKHSLEEIAVMVHHDHARLSR